MIHPPWGRRRQGLERPGKTFNVFRFTRSIRRSDKRSGWTFAFSIGVPCRPEVIENVSFCFFSLGHFDNSPFLFSFKRVDVTYNFLTQYGLSTYYVRRRESESSVSGASRTAARRRRYDPAVPSDVFGSEIWKPTVRDEKHVRAIGPDVGGVYSTVRVRTRPS